MGSGRNLNSKREHICFQVTQKKRRTVLKIDRVKTSIRAAVSDAVPVWTDTELALVWCFSDGPSQGGSEWRDETDTDSVN